MLRPSIVFVNRVYPPVPGATGRLLRDLARGFADKGWDVRVITSGPHRHTGNDDAVRVMRLGGPAKPRATGYALSWMRFLIGLPWFSSCDIIVTMTDPPFLGSAGHIFKTLKRARHIHWCQDLYPDLLPTLGARLPAPAMKILKFSPMRAMARADRVVVIGRCMAALLARGGMAMDKITIIPNWPEPELLAPSGDASGLEDRGHDQTLPTKSPMRFRVLYAGTIGRAHDMRAILDAAQRLEASHPDIEFVFVGEGPGFEILAQERARRGLDNVRLVPRQPERHLKAILESGDVHLACMKDAAAGMLVPSKIYAAFAVGRPCIFLGPSESEAARVIRDFKAGTALPNGQPEDLARTISLYYLNPGAWFAAETGARAAGRIFCAENAISSWIKCAKTLKSGDSESFS